MKKILVFAAFSLLAAATAFASGATDGTIDFSTPKTGLTAYGGDSTSTCTILLGKTSTGVGMGWGTSAVGYAVWTQHKSGNRAFGGSYDSTAIYYSDATTGTAKDATASKTDSSAFSGWTTM